MALTSHFRILSVAFYLGFKQAWATRITLFGSFLVYGMILIVWAGILKIIPVETLARLNLTATQLIWYMAATESVLFICPFSFFKDLQNDFVTAQADLALLRPYPASFLRAGLWSGEVAFRFLGLVPVFFMVSFLLAGPLPVDFSALAGFVLSFPLAVVIVLALTYMIGASCLWFVQAEPVFWIMSKLSFLFGALLFPMSFYPQAFQPLMWMTPFPAYVACAGNWFLALPPMFYVLQFLHQFLWALAAVLALKIFDDRVLRRFQTGKGVQIC
ncbi:MAG: hypothetical protein FWF24_01530 [Alphaproteobacteria bacterium]|nr:hypothetical protein [Alphaproteobacteria bacterium]